MPQIGRSAEERWLAGDYATTTEAGYLGSSNLGLNNIDGVGGPRWASLMNTGGR